MQANLINMALCFIMISSALELIPLHHRWMMQRLLVSMPQCRVLWGTNAEKEESSLGRKFPSLCIDSAHLLSPTKTVKRTKEKNQGHFVLFFGIVNIKTLYIFIFILNKISEK